MPKTGKRCWYWARDIQEGQHFTVVFNDAVKVKAILTETGAPKYEGDTLKEGLLQVAKHNPAGRAQALDQCGEWVSIAKLEEAERLTYWEEGVANQMVVNLPMDAVGCLRILAKSNQSHNMAILQFYVRTQ